MRQKVRDRIIREAKEWLDPFGIRWELYDQGTLRAGKYGVEDMMEVTFTQLTAPEGQEPACIRLIDILADDNGHILEAGNNYGHLTL
jgi:hypothetical protein